MAARLVQAFGTVVEGTKASAEPAKLEKHIKCACFILLWINLVVERMSGGGGLPVARQGNYADDVRRRPALCWYGISYIPGTKNRRFWAIFDIIISNCTILDVFLF